MFSNNPFSEYRAAQQKVQEKADDDTVRMYKDNPKMMKQAGPSGMKSLNKKAQKDVKKAMKDDVNESKFIIPEEIPANERTAFHGAAAAAAKSGKKSFSFAGKTHPVTMKKDAAKAIADEYGSVTVKGKPRAGNNPFRGGRPTVKTEGMYKDMDTEKSEPTPRSDTKVKADMKKRRKTDKSDVDMNPKLDKGTKDNSMEQKESTGIRAKLMSVLSEKNDRAKHYKGAMKPETPEDKLSGKGAKDMMEPAKNAKVDDTEEKGHIDAVKAGKTGPQAKARGGSDATRSGDQKIIPSATPTKGMKSTMEAYASMYEMEMLTHKKKIAAAQAKFDATRDAHHKAREVHNDLAKKHGDKYLKTMLAKGHKRKGLIANPPAEAHDNHDYKKYRAHAHYFDMHHEASKGSFHSSHALASGQGGHHDYVSKKHDDHAIDCHNNMVDAHHELQAAKKASPLHKAKAAVHKFAKKVGIKEAIQEDKNGSGTEDNYKYNVHGYTGERGDDGHHAMLAKAKARGVKVSTARNQPKQTSSTDGKHIILRGKKKDVDHVIDNHIGRDE